MAAATATAQAQAPAVPSAQVFYTTSMEPLSAVIARTQGDPRPQTAAGALQVGDWLFYSGLGIGAACGYNINSSPTNQIKACGPQFLPSLVAAYNTGIQRTLVYGVGDIRWYPSANQVQVVGTTAGIVHVWEIQRDLLFRVQAQGTRNQQYSGFAGNLAPTGIYITTPIDYTQGYGSTSIQKNFGPFFTAVGGSLTATAYQDARNNLGTTIDEHFQNGTITTANARFGYYISPIVYTYVEPTQNWQRYQASNLNSQGERVVLGVGTDRIGLFNGEIYGGFATQRFVDPAISTTTIPVVGGHLNYYLTRFLTLTLTADRKFATSDFNVNGLAPGTLTSLGANLGTGVLPGSDTTATTARFAATWDFSRLLAFSASVAEAHLDYLNSFRKDDLVTLTGGVTFKITPTWGVNLNYTHQNLYSNFPGAALTTDFISAGAQTKF